MLNVFTTFQKRVRIAPEPHDLTNAALEEAVRQKS